MREWSASSPPRLPGDPRLTLPEESRIPLPPSLSGSEDGGENEPIGPVPVSLRNELEIQDIIGEKDPSLMDADGHQSHEVVPDDVDVPMADAENLHLEESAGEEQICDSGKEEPKESAAEPPSDVPSTDVHQDTHQELPELSMSFVEMVGLVRQDAFERLKNLALRHSVSDLLRECGTNARLLPVQPILYRRLVDCFRTDKKAAFASLYAHRVGKESVSASTPATLVPTGGHARSYSAAYASTVPRSSWLASLSSSAQEAVIQFLNRIRTDHSFLADHLANLSTSQLASLVKPHRQPAVTESVLDQASSPYNKFDPRNLARSRPRAADSNRNPDTLSSDPLFLLIHCVFDPASQWGSLERRRQTEVWSSVCAKIIEDGRPGSDDFCLTVVDAFAELRPWTLKPEFELYLLDLISTDSQASLHSTNNTQPGASGSQSARQAVPSTDFFEKALNTLIELIVRDPAGAGVPPAALDLIHATLARIPDPVRRNKARSFFVSRWYCASFMANVLLYPERCQMLLSTYVSGAVRQRIFRELALRLQKVVFETLSPQNSSSNLVSLSADKEVNKLVLLFDPPAASGDQASAQPAADAFDRPFITLLAEDVLSLANALSMENSIESTAGSMINRTLSVASSFTGSSTLTAGTNTQNTGTASSLAPSTSGTTSTSISSNDLFMTGFDKSRQGSRTLEMPVKSRPSTSGDLFPVMEQDYIQSFLPELSSIAGGRASEKPKFDDAVAFYISDSRGTLTVEPVGLSKEALPQDWAQDRAPLDHTRLRDLESLIRALSKAMFESDIVNHKEVFGSSDTFASIEALFQEHMSECRSRHDFQSAYFWSKSLLILSQLGSQDKPSLIREVVEMYQERVRTNIRASQAYQEWLFRLQALQRRLANAFRLEAAHSEALRDKMWFITDVRHSSMYEQTLNIIRALKNMAAPPQPRQTGVAAWARQRFRTSFGQERVQAQVFEAIAAPREYGGPNKLSDNQVEVTSRWLTQESIENFCKSEERLHRFCLEIQKLAKKLVGEKMLDSPVLWSSVLYQQEKEDLKPRSQASTSPSTGLQQTPNAKSAFAFTDSSGRTPPSSNFPFPSSHQSLSKNAAGLGFTFGIPDASQTMPAQAYRGLGNGSSLQDPGLSLAYPLGLGTDRMLPASWMLPPSPISPDMGLENGDFDLPEEGGDFVDSLRRTVVALLISDFSQNLWDRGSETDQSLNDPRVSFLTAPRIVEGAFSVEADDTRSTETVVQSTANAAAPSLEDGSFVIGAVSTAELAIRGKARESVSFHNNQDGKQRSEFPFMESYEKLLKRFRLSYDPFVKLQALYDLTLLAESHDQASEAMGVGRPPLSRGDRFLAGLSLQRTPHGVGVPRTRLTRLEEVIANCEERRLMSLAGSSSLGGGTSLGSAFVAPPSRYSASTELPRAVAIVRSLLADKSYRPATLYRDLQLVASFVPSAILDHTPKGTAFWTIGLAAMDLKSETTKLMTSRATEILGFHLSSNSNKKEPTRADQQQQQRLHSPERQGHLQKHQQLSERELASTTLEDAARLYTLAAMEGDPTAARELALFYLTHPELVRRVTLPLSKPSEVFRSSLALGVVEQRSNSNGHSGGGATAGSGIGAAAAGDMYTYNNNYNTDTPISGVKNSVNMKTGPTGPGTGPATSTSKAGNKEDTGGGLDPSTFAVAFHWMEFAANAGDVDARTFLRENGDLGRGW